MMKCDPRAYARCPDRQYCGACAAECDFVENSDCDKFNRKVLTQPMTNADRIRAMSDEELAHFINTADVCDTRTIEECKFTYCAVCSVCVLDWLQQPVEEESK